MENDRDSRFNDRKYYAITMKIVTAVGVVVVAALAINAALDNFLLLAGGLFLGVLPGITLFVMLVRGNFYWPRIFLPMFALAWTTYFLVSGDGVRDEAVLGIPLAIALSGLLLSRSVVFGYTVAGMVILSLVGWAQIQGVIAQNTQFDPLGVSVLIQDFWILVIGALVYLTIDGWERALETVHEREADLERVNQALLDIQSALEDRIAERVRHLRVAREEAEAARREVERQSWQMTGLAQLGDVMSGERTIQELSADIIRFLCRYLDAPVGAIFLWEEDHLRLTGCYACEDGWKPVFKLGDGLVGQAAREQQPILMSGIPPEAIKIPTGFGDISPRQVIAVPFLFDRTLIGVFEIGTPSGFLEEHKAFLENAAERIGVTFHTSLTRGKIDRLLETTRLQTRELQHREEELQSLNEELQSQIDHFSP